MLLIVYDAKTGRVRSVIPNAIRRGQKIFSGGKEAMRGMAQSLAVGYAADQDLTSLYSTEEDEEGRPAIVWDATYPDSFDRVIPGNPAAWSSAVDSISTVAAAKGAIRVLVDVLGIGA